MSQNENSPANDIVVTSDPAEVERVRSLMADIDVAMLTTVDAGADDGRLTSRPLSTQLAEEDGDVLFLVRSSSHVVRDIRAHPQVNVGYTSKSAWVSLSGTAEVIEDRALIEELWSAGASFFMEGGPENPDNVVLKVHGDTAQVWGGESRVGMLVKVLRSVTGNSDETSDAAKVVDLP
ncbi:pyridoxamine 5'-phosphate oxidase family protein [Propioniciclava soli]|uniref:Pyridoxamine 5'-phosphate oxidase family protein n=1 Tax=Propioniciclava soli TaxID=2775081 RepID=A0ABZ3CB85_9ACTN|nr:pyridoxamine 5'-phosphate oxidase family protein [Propioniciclava soli]